MTDRQKATPLRRRSVLFILSAPSGGGKSTLYKGLLATPPDFIYSISCTTRKPRPGEVDGKDYYFLTHEEFKRRIEEGDFLEYAEVHGNYYGTPRSLVLKALREGNDVLVDVDTQGAAMIRANEHPEIRDAYTDVFLMPPSLDELRRRLAERNTETEEQMETRLRNAKEEMAQWPHYRYTITGSIEEVLAGFRAIMRAERSASHRLEIEI
jgi:guanylate kinase